MKLSRQGKILPTRDLKSKFQKQKRSNFRKSDRYGKIGMLMENARHRIPALFDAFGIKHLRHINHKYRGRCPVHGGDNSLAFSFYPDGREGKAFWECRTHHCERHFCGNLLGFVRGVLSHQLYGWINPGESEATQDEAIDFLCDFLNVDWNDIKINYALIEYQQFLSKMGAFIPPAVESKGICSRTKLRNLLEIPADYYIQRGFSAAVLDQYDIGYHSHPNSELYGRIVIPFYDCDGKNVIGCIGRTIYSECKQCELYHPKNMKCEQARNQAANFCKVKTSRRFNDKNHLYNFWYADKDILATREVAVVEGCADSWRLVESGITNVVALNGSDMSERQQIDLECSGATTIYCLTDNDIAGNLAYEQIRKRCWFAKVHRPKFPAKDIGEMTVAQIRQCDFWIVMYERLMRVYAEKSRMCVNNTTYKLQNKI